ncbi:MAG TPA: dephospho-CoA kinase [Steroidobacteraceae bacterium]|jgi:dephospho-CoA kinase
MSPLRVALTGGIASGKSTVADLFGARGIPIIDTDQIAREVVAPGTPLLSQVFDRFGAQLRRADGSLDRPALRRMVFEDPAKRRELEALLHPAIRMRTAVLAAELHGPYQILVIPLLVETNSRSQVDRVLVVDSSESLQLSRLRERDDTDAQQARAMLDSQASRDARLAVADDVIVNDGARAALTPKVAALHDKYLALAAAAAAGPLSFRS